MSQTGSNHKLQDAYTKDNKEPITKSYNYRQTEEQRKTNNQ